jgi:hypothetical protein
MGFLNQVAPWHLSGSPEKRFFVLTSEQSSLDCKVLACVTALHIPVRDGWYFAEVLRSDASPAGAMPLLILGAMEKLALQGAREVRLGMAPLAYGEVDEAVLKELKSTVSGRFLLALSTRDTSLYGFASAREFKRRLKPSRWEPLFLISSARPGLGLAGDILKAHFPESGVLGAIWKNIDGRLRQMMSPLFSNLAAKVFALRSGSPPVVTLVTGGLLLSLHILRNSNEAVARLFAANAYSPGDLSLSGLLIGPLFHNHLYHLTGDILSFLVFGGALEWLSGRRLLLTVMALGFWATNPLADLGVRALHSITNGATPNASAWLAFMAEKDYGSSNAVYAFVGALAVFINRRNSHWLWVPFALNGVYLCVARQSWLSLHHLAGLAGGAVFAALWLQRASGVNVRR